VSTKNEGRLEESIERSVTRYAIEQYGACARKMNGTGYRDWPDRLYLRTPSTQDSRDLWVEYKRRGERPRAGQGRLLRYLRATGHLAFVVDDVGAGKKIIDQWHRGDYKGVWLSPEEIDSE